MSWLFSARITELRDRAGSTRDRWVQEQTDTAFLNTKDSNNDVDRPDIATQFKPGNSAWRARTSHGRKPKFKSPDDLWEKCCEYFEWVNDNPLMAVELIKYQGVATQVELPKCGL